MEYTFPHYFEQFRCTASKCEDTCCAGWAIMIDEDSLEKYENYEGSFGSRLRNSVNWEEGCFHQYEKGCAFLNEDNLCDLHIEAGEEMLCDTCRNYPRHMEEFEGLREGSLSLSCIEAAKIILGCKDPVKFITMEDEEEDEEFEDFDFLLFTKLMDAREKMIAVLQNRDLDIMMRIGMVYDLAWKMQEALDADELFEIDDFLAEFGDMNMLLEFQKNSEEYRIGENEFCANMRKIFRVFSKLEVLKEDWPEYVKRAEVLLYGQGQSVYEQNRKAFHKLQGLESANHEVWSILLEQLMVYFVFTYFCGAVYDDNIAGKMETAVAATMLIQELAIARWIAQDKVLSFEDFVDISHRVSREIEHSDVNLIRLEKIFEKTAVFHRKEFFSVLMY